MARMVITTMLVIWLILTKGLRYSLKKRGQQKKGAVNFKLGVDENVKQSLCAFFFFFFFFFSVTKKIASESCLDLYFYALITELF